MNLRFIFRFFCPNKPVFPLKTNTFQAGPGLKGVGPALQGFQGSEPIVPMRRPGPETIREE